MKLKLSLLALAMSASPHICVATEKIDLNFLVPLKIEHTRSDPNQKTLSSKISHGTALLRKSLTRVGFSELLQKRKGLGNALKIEVKDCAEISAQNSYAAPFSETDRDHREKESQFPITSRKKSVTTLNRPLCASHRHQFGTIFDRT